MLNQQQEENAISQEAEQANRAAVAGHQDPSAVAFALIKLHRAGLLNPEHPETTQANRAAVAGHQYPRDVADALEKLHRAGLLNPERLEAEQARFNQLIEHTPVLFGTQEAEQAWHRIPGYLYTEADWDAIVALCERHQNNPAAGAAAFVRYVNRDILGIDEQRVAAPVNDGQSTHKASIHLSSSQSAKKLQERYQSEIDERGLESIINEIKAWAHAQPSDSISKKDNESIEETARREQHWKNAAAKRCIERLTAFHYSFEDRASKVSTRQLLALTWLAIHDEALRTAELVDAKEKYIEGLYDAQRIYNLKGKHFVDDMGPDNPACSSGAFNKLLEKLVSIHPDVIQTYITKTGASNKLGQFASLLAEEYLKNIPEATDITDELLWDAIKQRVTEQIFFEYGSLYISEALNDAFNTIMLKHDTTLGALAGSGDYTEFKSLLEHNMSADFNELIESGAYVPFADIIKEHQERKAVSFDVDRKKADEVEQDAEIQDEAEEKEGDWSEVYEEHEEYKEGMKELPLGTSEIAQAQGLSPEAMRAQRLQFFGLAEPDGAGLTPEQEPVNDSAFAA